MSNSVDPDEANPRYQVAPRPLPALVTVCELANTAAAQAVFIGYRSRCAPITTRRQTTDLALFGTYLQEQGFPPGALDTDPTAWQGITWGLVEGFIAWQLSAGYAVGTVNVRLATVKAYAKLAFKAGAIPHTEHLLIASVQGYRRREAQRLDQQRPITRRGSKKAAPLLPTLDQARQLKHQPLDTPTGRRDALLMCLLVDHGLRRSEIYGLRVGCIALEQGTLTFHRPNVDKTQTHELTADTLRAAFHYLTHDAPPSGGLLRPSRKGGTLATGMMSERAITKRAAFLGAAVGLPTLSPHDCRHYWATAAARNGTDIMLLMEGIGAARVAFDQNLYNNLMIALRAECVPADFAAAWADGETASTEDVLAWRPDLPTVPAPQAVAPQAASAADRDPLADAAAAPTEAATPSPSQFGLSEREIAVLQRLAQGMTNTEIAASLVLSRFTINAHLRSIYGKLGVSTRTAAARYAIEHKLI